jgi:pimeloyl-ACP methyl ester carboxylesterase
VSARAPYDTLAGDVLAAVELLKRHPSIDSSQIGLWGLSEGEWVAPLAASRMSHPAFLILASASSMTPAEQVRTEVGRLLRAKGYPDTTVALARGLYARISEFERTGNGRDELNGALGRVATAEWFKDAKYLSGSVPDHAALLKAAWFRTWRANMDFDALPILRALDCPVLVLLGGKDLKYDPALTVARYTDALGGKPDRQFAVKVFPNATHAMVEWWLPLHVPPPRYPAGYFDLQREWIRSSLLGR